MQRTPHTPEDAPDIPHADKIDPALESLAVSIKSLTADPANARKHDQRNLDSIKGSLALFGQRKPIVVRRAGMVVIAGNGTMAAAKALGWERIAAVVVDDDTAMATAFGIADNRSSQLATWDEDVLATLLGGLRDTHICMEDLGFTEQEQVDLIGTLDQKENNDPPSCPTEKIPCVLVYCIDEAHQKKICDYMSNINESFRIVSVDKNCEILKD